MAKFLTPSIPDLDSETLNSQTNWSSNPFATSSSASNSTSSVDPRPCNFRWSSDFDSDADCDISSFVTDLFHRGDSAEHLQGLDGDYRGIDFSIWGSEDTGEIGSTFVNELGSGFDFGVQLETQSDPNTAALSAQVVDSHNDGLRVVGLDSESDEYFDNGAGGVVGLNSGDNASDWFENQDLNWDSFNFYERQETISVNSDEIEELAVPFSIGEESDGEDFQFLDWEMLLAISNLGRNTNSELESNSESNMGFHDYYHTNTAEYNTLFSQFVENENVLKGAPPASRSVVENLPLVDSREKVLEKENFVCAVCKEKISMEEKVRRLPCCHYYHEDCIFPWLSIRNTCPVCRYELPTDDPDYERRKSETTGYGLPRDLQDS